MDRTEHLINIIDGHRLDDSYAMTAYRGCNDVYIEAEEWERIKDRIRLDDTK